MAVDAEADASSRIEDGASELVPCDSCGRKFRPEALARHVPICQKSKSKPKQVFDIKAKRREAIIQENNVDNAHEVFNQTSSNTSNNKTGSERGRRNSFIESKTPPPKAPPIPQSKHTPIKRKPANAPRGGPPKPKPEAPKPPQIRTQRRALKKATATTVTSKQTPAVTSARRADSTANNISATSRSQTPSRSTPRKRGTSSPVDINGNNGSGGGGTLSRKTQSRSSVRGGAPTMRRAISSPNIDTNNNQNKHKEGPVVKFKEKFPNHVNPNLNTFSAMFNKSQGQAVPISIRKPRTVPGVRTGGHSGVEFADPELLKRPSSSIELDSGWDSKRFTEDYVLRHSPRAATGGSMTDLRTPSVDVCSKCNSPFLVSTAKFCFNCGEKRI